jgi:GT2 family glycosyltransferase
MVNLDIVIPSAGRADDLLRLLGSLHAHGAQSVARRVRSITVSDDRPCEATAARVAEHFPSVSYVHGPARGPAANRNHGAGRGSAAWILFLDDDCYTEVDIVDAYARGSLAQPGADVLEGSIQAVGEKPNGNHHAPLNPEGGRLWSCNFAIRRDRLQALGGFDERFPYAAMEDVDFHTRARRVGATIAFIRDAAVFHPWRSISEREVTRQIVSHAIYADLHVDFIRAWTLVHLLRVFRGKFRQYAAKSRQAIPSDRYRTVVYDFVSPVAVLAAVRVGPLRRLLVRRHVLPRSRQGLHKE